MLLCIGLLDTCYTVLEVPGKENHGHHLHQPDSPTPSTSIIQITIPFILVTISILVGTNEVGEGPWLAALPPHYLLVIILPRPAARILTTSRRNLECAECLKRDHHCLGKISGMH